MKNRTLLTHSDYRVLGQGWGGTQYLYGFGGNQKTGNDSFSFTGFGTGDPNRRAPTTGSYLVSRRVPVIAQSDMYWGTLGTDQMWYVRKGSYMSWQVPSWILGLDCYHDSVVRNEAIDRLMEKLKSSSLNLAVSLGEYRETGRMLRKALDSTLRVISMARDLRRTLRTAPWKVLTKRQRRDFVHNPSLVISKVWLGMKYGWLPLYSDVYNLLNHTSKTYDEVEVTAQRRKKHRWTISNKNFHIGWANCYCNMFAELENVSQVEYKVVVSASDQTAFDVQRITSLNPLSIAWELTPFSFVFDWFVDVGGYLEAQEFALLNGLKFQNGYETKTAWLNGKEQWWPAFGNASSGIARATRYDVKKQRIALTTFPRPSFPKLNVNLGGQRIMSAAALLRTVLLGGLKH